MSRAGKTDTYAYHSRPRNNNTRRIHARHGHGARILDCSYPRELAAIYAAAVSFRPEGAPDQRAAVPSFLVHLVQPPRYHAKQPVEPPPPFLPCPAPFKVNSRPLPARPAPPP
eukprot:SAG31_NODE_26756_length_437_cov_0.704142_2_plen_112_part_01